MIPKFEGGLRAQSRRPRAVSCGESEMYVSFHGFPLTPKEPEGLKRYLFSGFRRAFMLTPMALTKT